VLSPGRFATDGTIEPVTRELVPAGETDHSSRRLIGRLWRDWMRVHLRTILLAFLLMIVVAATSGLYPLIIDQAIGAMTDFESGAADDGDRRLLLLLPLAVILVTLAKGLASYGQSVLVQKVAFKVISALQQAMFAHLMRADTLSFQATATGKLVSRFTVDVFIMRDGMSKAMTSLVRDLLTVAILIGAMFYLNWMLAAGVFIVFPLSAIPIVKLGKKLRKVSKSTQAEMGQLSHVMDESFAGIRLIKAYRLEAHAETKAARAIEVVRGLLMKSVHARARTYPVLEVLGGIAVAAVFGVGSAMILAGYGSLGEFAGFVAALLMAYQPATGLGGVNASVQEALAAAQRVFELLDQQPAIVDRPDAKPLAVTAGEVRFDDVAYSYPTRLDSEAKAGGEAKASGGALRGLSLVARPGRTTALVGPSGAGKSTAFNLIPRFFDVGSGSLTIDGREVGAVTIASLRDAIALVSQDITLFDDTVRANIGFGRAAGEPPTDEEIVAAAKAAAAHDFIMALPEGYDTNVGEHGGRLSGGQRQRIAIARAMLKDAPILLLDEATSALDAESEMQVQLALARLMKDRTTIVIAHRLATVRDADDIYVLDEGRVVEHGRHAELLARGGLYARLCRIQFRQDQADADALALAAEG
jgi:ATP-binding cassette, subfamily B, bacterial MsbA